MKSQIGLGAGIFYLMGGSQHRSEEYIGDKILKAEMTDTKLTLTLLSGREISIWDNGQSCCEYRYMSTDDDIKSLVGGKIVSIIDKPGPDIVDEHSDVHEQVFVEIQTDKGFITIANHNEHNGYYGGFGLTITEETVDVNRLVKNLARREKRQKALTTTRDRGKKEKGKQKKGKRKRK